MIEACRSLLSDITGPMMFTVIVTFCVFCATRKTREALMSEPMPKSVQNPQLNAPQKAQSKEQQQPSLEKTALPKTEPAQPNAAEPKTEPAQPKAPEPKTEPGQPKAAEPKTEPGQPKAAEPKTEPGQPKSAELKRKSAQQNIGFFEKSGGNLKTPAAGEQKDGKAAEATSLKVSIKKPPPMEQRPKHPGKVVEQEASSQLRSLNLIKDEEVSFN